MNLMTEIVHSSIQSLDQYIGRYPHNLLLQLQSPPVKSVQSTEYRIATCIGFPISCNK